MWTQDEKKIKRLLEYIHRYDPSWVSVDDTTVGFALVNGAPAVYVSIVLGVRVDRERLKQWIALREKDAEKKVKELLW